MHLLQVCPPGLHISLGIFYKMWCLIEEGCHQLDLELATRISHTPHDRQSFQEYSSLVRKLRELREKRMSASQLVSSLNNVLGDLAINSGSSSPLVQALTLEVQTQAKHLEKLVCRNYSNICTSSKVNVTKGEGDFHH